MSMRKWTTYLITDFISYAILCLLFSVLALAIPLWHFTPVFLLQLFAVTSAIAALQYCVSFFVPERFGAVTIAGQLACVALAVFGLGGLVFRWFPFRPLWVLIVLGLLVAVYFGVIGLLILKDRQDAAAINRAIRQKNKAGETGETE